MSSDDNKNLTFEKPKKKEKKSIGWVIGVVVLILISITFILPTTMFAGNNDIVFGSIRGKDISYTNQYFQTQASFAQSQYGEQANSLQGMYTIFNQAFLSTAATMALNDMAKDAGVEVTNNYVDRAIVNSGFYSNGDGVFNAELYNNASNYERDTFRAFAEESVASDMVIRDISNAHASDAEVALIQDLNGRGKTFDYVVLSAAIYPEEDVISYALEHQDAFLNVTINSVTLPTEEEANTVLSSINNGTTTLLEAAEASANTADGERGGVFAFTLSSEIVGSDASAIINANSGDIVGPIQTNGGYTIYEIVEEAALPENPSEEDFAIARSYIASQESEMMTSFLDEKSAEFEARLASGEDFFDISDDMGLDLVTVSSTTANPGEFPLFSTFQMTDPGQNLYSATYTNGNYMNELYQSEEGDVLSPITLANGNRLITRVGNEEVRTSASSYIEMMYDYFKPQMALNDLQNAIFRDPTFEDNFTSVFFSRVLSSTN